MQVLHANWSGDRLLIWAETDAPAPDAIHSTGSASGPAAGNATSEGERAERHPFATDVAALRDTLRVIIPQFEPEAAEFELSLPAREGGPTPSRRLAHARGISGVSVEDRLELRAFVVPALAYEPSAAGDVLDRTLEWLDLHEGAAVSVGAGFEFFAAAARLARGLIADQRFVPMLRQDGRGGLNAAWSPWASDGGSASRVAALLRAMPPVARSARDDLNHDSWSVLDSFLAGVVDARCRRVLIDEEMNDTIEDRSLSDAHVAWLTGLLDQKHDVPVDGAMRAEMVKQVRRWVGALEERGQAAEWRLLLRLNEPLEVEGVKDLQAPPEEIGWTVSFHLQAVENPEVVIDAADIWIMTGGAAVIGGHRLEQPQDLLLGELGRASKLHKPLEKALDQSEPIELSLATTAAYEFLREVRPLLIEQGFAVETPPWWESPNMRLGARLRLEDEPGEAGEDRFAGASGSAAGASLGLSALVKYHWEIAIGDATLSLHEFERLAGEGAPLVRVDGKWVEIRPEDVKAAVKFIQANPGGQMQVGEALRLAYVADQRETGVPVLGMEAGGWIASMLDADTGSERLPQLEQPEGFQGTLRPYQVRGLSWLAFLEQFGFGLCLADDMGLGKTVQVLALLVHERTQAAAQADAKGAGGEAGADGSLGPTLLVVPTSVVGNWTYEASRFSPSLNVLVHHGLERHQGSALVRAATEADIVVTTYALANRDREVLELVPWRRVVLDEAQSIKNPQAKQAQAVRSFKADRRLALTGTPVENRLSELWSIMDFLNPGYLGTVGAFRKRFSVPIERYHDAHRMSQLRGLVRPFILRRLKTDPTVVSDLPEKLESKELCHLTSEQAELYESCVKRMLNEVESAEGIHRRGLVLSTLIKLKQICNHPSQLLKDHSPGSTTPPDPRRSGKTIRILEQLSEVLAEGDKALVFTQFRQMGRILAETLRHELDQEVLFLHGGTPHTQRQAMIDTFQAETGRCPIFILSLKAGGVGLNLTAANHVFHYDRWWNPAVENQATDRAYRIGQTRTVFVHKYLVRGTLEERIDEMIESKTELAENVIGSGERWLTELSTTELRDVLALRAGAVGDEE